MERWIVMRTPEGNECVVDVASKNARIGMGWVVVDTEEVSPDPEPVETPTDSFDFDQEL